MSPAPKTSACVTLYRLFSALRPPSCTISSVVPAGRPWAIFAVSARTASAMLTVLASRVRDTEMLTLGLPLRIERDVTSA